MAHFIMLLFSIYILLQTILQQKINPKSNRFVLYLMIVFTIISIIAFTSSFKSGFSKFFIFLYIPAFLYISPYSYLYIKSLTATTRKKDKKDQWHFFVPTLILISMFIVNLLLIILHYGRQKEATLQLLDIYFYMNAVSLLVVPVLQLFYYGYLIIKTYRNHLKEIENYFSNTDEAKMSWIRWFIGVFIAFMIIFNIVNFNLGQNTTLTDILYYTEMVAFTGFLGFFAIKQADIYRLVTAQSDSSNNYAKSERNEGILETEILPEEKPFAQNSVGLSSEKKDQIFSALLQIMVEQKPYLNPSLTITELAESINSNQKYLSIVINERFEKNFFSFINEYRIKEAIEILKTTIGKQYSIEGIGNSAGFHSRSTFITAFKKATGVTPSEYKSANL